MRQRHHNQIKNKESKVSAVMRWVWPVKSQTVKKYELGKATDIHFLGRLEKMHTPSAFNSLRLIKKKLKLPNHLQKEWIRHLTILWSMHSLAHSHILTLTTACWSSQASIEPVSHELLATILTLKSLLPRKKKKKKVALNQFAGCLQTKHPTLGMARFFQTQCSKCLSLAGLDMTLKRRRGRSVSLDFAQVSN